MSFFRQFVPLKTFKTQELMKKKILVPPSSGKGSRQSQRVKGWMQTFFFVVVEILTVFDILSRHFEKHLHTMKLTPRENVGIVFFIFKSNNRVKFRYLEFFIAKFWISLIFHQKSQYQVRHVLWRHNYLTSRSIVLILVCMDRVDLFMILKPSS